MYNLSEFAFSDMVDCGAWLRRIAEAASSMEEAADLVVSYLFQSLRDDAGDPACALVRCFVTLPFGELEPELQEAGRLALGHDPPATTKSLTLLATAGRLPAWNDRRQSTGHRAIPLDSEQMIAQSPMVSRLITQFGLDVGTLLEPAPDPDLILDLEQRTYNVFHVVEAAGSPHVPAQERFVVPFGIKSVLGFGGILPGGKLLAFILFTTCTIRPETASLFKTLGLTAKLAVMPFALGPIFAAGTATALPAEVDEETLGARLAALEQLLDVYESTAAEQAHKLELALLQLREADERFRALVQNSSDLITVVDRNSRISYQSPSLATVLGYPAGSRQGTDWMELVHPDDRASFRTQLQDVIDLRHPAGGRWETRLHHADGTWRDVEIRTENLLLNPAVAGIVLNARDISGHKRTELALAQARDEALAASKAKSGFLAVMSHEIRTPMNGVIGLTGLLLDGPLSETQRHHAEGVRASGEALLGIINNILDFSKIEAGRLELEAVDFDLRQAVDDVAGLVAEPARAKGLELVVDCRPELPASLRGDVGRLRQILLNLASNAVKFTQAGEVVLRASLAAGEPAPGQVLIRFDVTDTGIGIDPAMANRLFDPFAQADASTTRRFGGTGLGLAICRRLAEAMGGGIGLDSRPGNGADFWVQLPFSVAGQTVSPAAGESLAGRRILVVDDNRTNRLVLSSQLRAWDVVVDQAKDAQEALERLHLSVAGAGPYDAAIVDMDMPGMDGMELARQVRADPDVGGTPLLLLSSVPVEADAAARAGFAARLMKPVRSGQLGKALAHVMAPAQEPQAATVAPALETPFPSNSRGTVLVVDDHTINQEVAKGILAKLGYRCDLAGDGVEALAALERRAYDAVLMDCRMPRMDGFEATAEIRRREAGGRRVPIVAMTANALVEDRDRCMAAGMDGYLAKPVKEQELRSILDHLLFGVETSPAPAGDAGPAPVDGNGVLDLEQFALVRALGDSAVLRTLVEQYLQDAAVQVDALRRIAEGSEPEPLRAAAHGLKGSSATMGARSVAAACEALERAASEGRMPAREALERVSVELDRAAEAMRSHLA